MSVYMSVCLSLSMYVSKYVSMCILEFCIYKCICMIVCASACMCVFVRFYMHESERGPSIYMYVYLYLRAYLYVLRSHTWTGGKMSECRPRYLIRPRLEIWFEPGNHKCKIKGYLTTLILTFTLPFDRRSFTRIIYRRMECCLWYSSGSKLP